MPTALGSAELPTRSNYPPRCIYVAPYRALATEVESSFASLFQDLGYGASTVPGGYDQDAMGEELAASDDVLVLTPEKLDLLFRLQSDILNDVRLIVIDEGHIVSDAQRGPKFELLISRLRRRLPGEFLMMSAVVNQTLEDFAVWLSGDRQNSVSTSGDRRSETWSTELEWNVRHPALLRRRGPGG